MSFNAVVKVVKKVDNFSKIVANFDKLKGREVLIGVPQEENTGHEGQDVTNAQLLFIHCEGAPMANIPARPVLQMAIKEEKAKIAEVYGVAIKKALTGKSFEGDLDRLGLHLQNKARAKFGSDELAPLQEATKKRKAGKIKSGKNGKTKQDLQAEMMASNGNPLIDTGELRKSVTYVVRGRK